MNISHLLRSNLGPDCGMYCIHKALCFLSLYHQKKTEGENLSNQNKWPDL